jgi:hypothetical protein
MPKKSRGPYIETSAPNHARNGFTKGMFSCIRNRFSKVRKSGGETGFLFKDDVFLLITPGGGMGRKSLLKSTTKKKTKKKTGPKKPVKAAAAKKTSVKAKPAVKAKKAMAAKTAPKAKPKAKVQAKAKKAPAVKKATPKKAAPAVKKGKVTLKELLSKKFDLGKAPRLVSIKKKVVRIPGAPPFVTGESIKEVQKIKAMLLKQFDLKDAGPVKAVSKAKAQTKAKKAPVVKKTATKKAPAATKGKVSLNDLLFKKFDLGKVPKPVSIKKKAAKLPEASPFVSGYDKKETQRITALLSKPFDLKDAGTVKAVKEVPTDKPKADKPKVMPAAIPIETPPPYQPFVSTLSAGSNQTGNAMKLGLCALALLIAIIIGTSASNRSKFYLKNSDSGVEVWRGKFAPAGAELVHKLDGVKAPSPLRESYSKKEISPLLFGYLQDKADTVLDQPSGPDIGKMKGHLRQAAEYATTMELQNRIQRRLKGIDFIVAFHKADVALGKGTLPDLRAAKASLATAYSSSTTDSQRELVEKTRAVVDQAIVASKTK